jgi:1,4-dihydroxy-2-naphthoyl-CoA synthase
MTEQEILIERQGAVGVITINRPARRNAVRYEGWRAIAAAVGELGREAAVRAIVLRGAGEEAFSAGADITEFPTFRSDRESGARYHEAVAGALAAIGACPTPVIAMIHGHCIGGGCELAVACDLRLADEAARFAIPSARRGIILGVAELRGLRELVGLGAAKELLLDARRERGAGDRASQPGGAARCPVGGNAGCRRADCRECAAGGGGDEGFTGPDRAGRAGRGDRGGAGKVRGAGVRGTGVPRAGAGVD